MKHAEDAVEEAEDEDLRMAFSACEVGEPLELLGDTIYIDVIKLRRKKESYFINMTKNCRISLL